MVRYTCAHQDSTLFSDSAHHLLHFRGLPLPLAGPQRHQHWNCWRRVGRWRQAIHIHQYGSVQLLARRHFYNPELHAVPGLVHWPVQQRHAELLFQPNAWPSLKYDDLAEQHLRRQLDHSQHHH